MKLNDFERFGHGATVSIKFVYNVMGVCLCSDFCLYKTLLIVYSEFVEKQMALQKRIVAVIVLILLTTRNFSATFLRLQTFRR